MRCLKEIWKRIARAEKAFDTKRKLLSVIKIKTYNI